MAKKGVLDVEDWLLIATACIGVACFFSNAVYYEQILRSCYSHNEAQLDTASMWIGIVPVIGMSAIPFVYALVLFYAWKTIPDYSHGIVVFSAFTLEVMSFFVWLLGFMSWQGFLNRSKRVIDLNEEQCLRHMADQLYDGAHALQPLFILDTVFFVIFCTGIIIDARRKGIKFMKI